MKNNRSNYIIPGVFLCTAGGAFAAALLFYLSGTALLCCEILLCLLAACGAALIIKGVRLPKDKPLSRRETTVRLAVTAVMLGCVAVTKLFRLEIPMFGGAGMTVGFSGVFTAIPAMLYGPMFGAVASASSDLLGCIISPIGAYNPLFTLTAFTGGFIKGSVWMLIRGVKSGLLRTVSLVCACVLAVFGVSLCVSLQSDGIYSGVLAEAEEIPSPGTLKDADVSPLTSLVLSLASYSKDTYTITGTDSTDSVTVPAKVVIDGMSYVPRIGKNAFADVDGDIYIPPEITKIDHGAFADGAVVHVQESSLELLEGIDGIVTVVEDSIEKTAAELAYGGASGNGGGFAWEIKLSHASAVAKYTNFLTLGTLLASGSILALSAVGAAIAYYRRKKGKEASEVSYLRVFAAIFASGSIVTTLNTLILQYITYPSWSGRAFYILWIPRIAEELIVCLVQSYFIAALYDIYSSRFAKRRY